MTETAKKSLKTINSLSEYLNYIDTIKDEDLSSGFLDSCTFYRGQANSMWSLMPSLYRNNLLPVENVMLKKMKHLCPSEFVGDEFEILTKFQHFGMPTRLLDTTTNPLIALFFACDREEKSDGVIYIFPNIPVLWSNDSLIALYMDFIFNSSVHKIDLQRYWENLVKRKQHICDDLNIQSLDDILRYLTHTAYAVRPLKSNQRIQAQDGAFFMCGMKIKCIEKYPCSTLPSKYEYSFQPPNMDFPQTISHKCESIIIPAQNKKTILNELNRIGINEMNLFPDLSHQINYVVNSLSNNIIFKYY